MMHVECDSACSYGIGHHMHRKHIIDDCPHYSIIAGEYLVVKGNVCVSTLLGSCIAVCLLAARGDYCGMNHFMLPKTSVQYEKAKDILHTDSGFYGINAMELLINDLMKKGVKKRSLVAKVFGGADIFKTAGTQKTVGRQNVEFITEFLELEKIPLIACSTGGTFARKIYLFAHTGEVYQYRLGHRPGLHVRRFLKKENA